MFTATIDEREYDDMIHITKIEMESHRKDQPYQKAIQIFYKIVKNHVHLYQEIAGYLGSASYEEFVKNFEEIKKSFSVISEFYGYITKDKIKKIESIIQPHLNQEEDIIAKSLNVADGKVLDYIHFHKEIDGSYVYRTINDLNSEVNTTLSSISIK